MSPRVGKYRGPIVDSHTHLRLAGFPALRKEPHRINDYLREIRGLDVRHVAALVMAPKGAIARTRRMNDRVLELGRSSTNPFFALCSVHPADGAEAFSEIDRVARLGAKGLKLHPNTQQFDVADPSVARVVERASQRGLPVLFDAYSPFDADQPGKFVRLAIGLPQSRIVLAHALGPRFPDLLVYDILGRYDWWKRNVWVDLSATGPLWSESPFRDQFLWAVRRAGSDRLLFGSDYPLDRPGHAVSAVAALGFSAEELRMVFFENAVRLYELT